MMDAVNTSETSVNSYERLRGANLKKTVIFDGKKVHSKGERT